MQVLSSFDGLRERKVPVVLAAGFFDGVHIGHQCLLDGALIEAKACAGEAWAMTFDPHPLRILNPAQAPPLLTSTRHKLQLIEQRGIHGCLVLSFDRDFAALSAEAFAMALLDTAPPLCAVMAGYDWRFGAGGRGGSALLRALVGTKSVLVRQIDSVHVDGAPVSSTRVRQCVMYGWLDEAERMLGRRFSVLGTVRHGLSLGHKIGFPTANLDPHNEVIPPYGVYAVRARWRGETFDGAFNYGVRPSISRQGRHPSLELHLFNFSEDLYGEDVEVCFISRIREERTFADLAALRRAIDADCREARRILSFDRRESAGGD